jgi:CDP-diacylglycerol--glycerol-3-phosphate 3-phosphatidyltransferase
MTLANKITILRILMIPVFVFLLIQYVRDYQRGTPVEWMRYAAVGVFVLAAVSDGVDGFIARRFNQKSVLGAYLDPIADKALLISALVMLSRDHGEAFAQLPLWFPVLVISRDAILVVGTVLIYIVTQNMKVHPRMVGKAATLFQMITLGWVMLKIQQPPHQWFLYAAGICTFVSGAWYFYDGVKLLNVASQAHPVAKE